MTCYVGVQSLNSTLSSLKGSIEQLKKVPLTCL